MRVELEETIDFEQTETIIAKEGSNLEEWKECVNRPFISLNQNEEYSVIAIMVKKYKNGGFSVTGTPEKLIKRLEPKIDDSEKFYFKIYKNDKIIEQWYIKRYVN